ncbi:hypothetical protein MHBO_004018 [Bonamia ostreae]
MEEYPKNKTIQFVKRNLANGQSAKDYESSRTKKIKIENTKNRDNFTKNRLPSIAMYTVFNSTQEDVKCTVSKNGRFVAMVNRNSTINVWDAKERSAMELAGHKSVVYDCEFLNFHDLAITASADKTCAKFIF